MTQKTSKQMMAVAATVILTTFASMGMMPAVAQAAQESALPAAAQQGDVQFLSGGVGLDESHAIKSAAAHWPLSLEFIGGQRDFVADVDVKITDAKGNLVLTTTSQGPYMLVRLKPGRYSVAATYGGSEKKQSVSVSQTGHARLHFSWTKK
jgi:hypothetical protein